MDAKYGFNPTPAVVAALAAGVLVETDATVTVSEKSSPNGKKLEAPYSKVSIAFDGKGTDAKGNEIDTVSPERFLAAVSALYGNFQDAAADLIYAHDLGAKANIRQDLMKSAEGPDKAYLASAKKLVGLPGFETLEIALAKVKAMATPVSE